VETNDRSDSHSQFLMEPEVSLPCSQKPAIDAYPEPDESNPSRHILIT
jgi:hypothetical protein